MHAHPVLTRAIVRNDGEATVSFHTTEPHVRSSSGKGYFTKIGLAYEKEQFIGEAETLRAMHKAAPGLAPRLIECGIIDEEVAEHQSDVGKPYFVSEYKSLGPLTDASAKKLAKRLATEMHQYKSTQGFGFAVPTYCGKTRQENGWHETWEQCYDAMIGGLLTKLAADGAYSELCAKGKLIRKRVISSLLGPLDIQPVLLHGDLWSGNTGTDTETGDPIVFDASSYFGHNEADLAIARIFGGFPKSFFTTYHQHLPKSDPENQYDLRGELYELYHYLNHTILFGSSYAGTSSAKMDKLLKAVPE
ncbi:fructosamine kinase PKL/CAK/FruK [Cytidiella melzeri]|nr:fructosamine kinase PKL/CAK/FruK [Cytidiella melzeri]